MTIAARDGLSDAPFGLSRLAEGFPELRFGFREPRNALRPARMAIATCGSFSDVPLGGLRFAEGSPTLRLGFRASRWALRCSVWAFASRGKSNDHEIGLERMTPWLEAERGRSIRNSRSDMIMKRNNKMKSVFSPLWMALWALLVFLPACGDDFEETDLTGRARR